jgi:DNA-directed RNA polymerase specialized sigma24 family protein
MNPFPFDDARRLAASALKRYRDHRDFEDLVSETIVSAWKAKERHPEMALGLLVTTSAGFMIKKWFSDGRCGDLVGPRGKERVPVFTMRYHDDDEQMEPEEYDDQVVPDFTEALIEQIASPASEDEGEIRLTGWEKRQQREAERKAAAHQVYLQARKKERELAEYLLTDDLLLPHYREAIRLHYVEGWPMKRVSEAVGTHWTNLYEGIRNAQRRLERIGRGR